MKKFFLNYYNVLIKSIFAGIMIGIGGTAFLALDNKIVGSFLFSIGLLTICMWNMNLYTGKIGYIINNKISYLFELLIILIGNFIGTLLTGFLIRITRFDTYITKAKEITNIKLEDSFASILILSMFCGILMYIAVNNFKTHKDIFGKYVPVILCVMVFILCGFEHCVANMYYFSVANVWNFHTIIWTLTMVLGNSIGAILFGLYYNKYNKKSNN